MNIKIDASPGVQVTVIIDGVAEDASSAPSPVRRAAHGITHVAGTVALNLFIAAAIVVKELAAGFGGWSNRRH